jgi:V8-like Glu-specific endopeptidase
MDSPLLDATLEAGLDEEVLPRLTPFVAEEEVIGPDERQLVAETLGVPNRWICSLDVTYGKPYPKGWTSGLARGSGGIVGPRPVLPAANGIYADGGTSPKSIVVAPARNGPRTPLGTFKAVAWTVSSRAFAKQGIARDFDFGIVHLDHDIATPPYKALGNKPLGYWGSPSLGHGTELGGPARDRLAGKRLTVCGYPGDRCGTQPLDLKDPKASCSKDDQATTQWISNGLATLPDRRPRLFHHTADTAKGQSGSPVWIRYPEGRRCLVGLHVAPHVVLSVDATGTTKALPVQANEAVHLSDEVVRLIRAWLT